MLHRKNLSFVVILVLLGFGIGACTKKPLQQSKVQSPNGLIALNLGLDQKGQAFYTVNYDCLAVMDTSYLGFVVRQLGDISQGLTIASVEYREVNEPWERNWGETKKVNCRYNEMAIQFNSKTPKLSTLSVVFRVFDDGFGFRYQLTGNPSDSVCISNELTEFNFYDNPTTWWTVADYDSYEKLYTKSRLSQLSTANTPVTMQSEKGLVMCIHEAALIDYPDMTLLKQEKCNTCLKATLVPWPDGDLVKAKGSITTPWRTIHLVEKPKDLVASNLIVNLNEPSVIKDESWIKPMKYIGIWWGMHIGYQTWDAGKRHGATTENALEYIDFAAKNNVDGVLFEGWNTGWEEWGGEDNFDYVTPYPDFDLKKVTAYAKSKEVHIIGHLETGGNIPMFERHLDSALVLYNHLGINAVKTGYAGTIRPKGQFHHGQWMVNHYERVVQKAAENKIMIDVHEPIKPTGIRRTYPNLMTGEGVRGMEWNGWSTGNPPSHTAILPYTRMIAGPIDYTPGIFDLLYKRYADKLVKWQPGDKGFQTRVHTTLSKQLGLMVVLYSPLQMASDLIENYQDNDAFDFIRNFNADIDTTAVINGEIGEFITIARRSGEKWFVGCITNEKERIVNLPFDYLEPGKKYQATIYKDAKNTDYLSNPEAYEIEIKQVESRSELPIRMGAGGGFAVLIEPLNE